MKRFKLYNNIVGWLVFLVTFATYALTVEPSASFWDCPEFVTAAARLEIGHPPGAPFFMLTGNVFSHLTSDPAKVALMVNLMSALLSAFTILFLFWTITHMVRRVIVRDEVCVKDGTGPTPSQTLVIMASGLGGALAYAWSDTFWFSAVEAEVYAYSSMFTALVVLLMLKWEEHSHEPRSDRWIVLIFYLMGLSIGVHLLNLLCLPALVLIYTFIRYPKTGYKGSFFALGLSFVLVVAVLYGLVPGIVKVGGWFELFFVNRCGLPFNTGMIIYFAVLITTVLAAIYATTRRCRPVTNVLYTASVALLGIPFFGKGPVMPFVIGGVILTILFVVLFVKHDGQYIMRKQALNTSMLCMLMLMIGYSTYAVTVVRSTQDPPMDQNSPEDIFTLSSYLNREQYGDSPLIYGHAYTSVAHSFKKAERVRYHYKTPEEQAAGAPDSYDVFMANDGLDYPKELQMLLPRMHSTGQAHSEGYEMWLGGVKKHPVTYTYEYEGKKYTAQGEMPSQVDNFLYFVSYQVYYQYLRYFLWNFAGRQNDISGHGAPTSGDFLTGFSFIDDNINGDHDKMPDYLKHNKGHNVYYCLPLILGIIGLVWQLRRGKRGTQHFWVVFFLFFMTGLAIVLYINQPPSQPRERDYVYVGSFYAFSIWIGYGIAAIATWPRRIAERLGRTWDQRHDMKAALAAATVAIAVPLQMVSQTWDDHDRSGRRLCPDVGYDYMASFDKDTAPILFTTGDNHTFPLWYAQDIEGWGRNVRAVSLSYLQLCWYIDQLRTQKWDSPALPIAWQHNEYLDDVGRDYFAIRHEDAQLRKLKADLVTKPEVRSRYTGGTDPYELTFVIDNYLRNPERGYFPTDSLVMTIDKEAVMAAGITIPRGFDSIPDKMHISLKGRTSLWKSDVMILEILARNNWKRPIYFSSQCAGYEMAGLRDYVLCEGFVSRVVPFKVGTDAVNTERMYDNMVNRYRYGGINRPGVYIDEANMDMCYVIRKLFVKLATALIEEGKTDKARHVLEHCKQMMPSSSVPYNGGYVGYDSESSTLRIADCWLKAGCKDEAERYLTEVSTERLQLFEFYNSAPSWRIPSFEDDLLLGWKILDAAYRGLQECGSPRADELKAAMDRLSTTPCGRRIAAGVDDFEKHKQRYADSLDSLSKLKLRALDTFAAPRP